MRKKAVLIGCNYPGTKVELKGCINDVKRMQKCLVDRYHFRKHDITLLIDSDHSFIQPTGANIRKALSKLVKSAEEGDVLFVHYSGHGTRLPAETGEDDDTGYDECIVPSDMNLITDDDIREFVNQVPKGCRITIVSDSCHSGGLIDEAKEQIGESTKYPNGNPSFISGVTTFIHHTIEEALEATHIMTIPSLLHSNDKGVDTQQCVYAKTRFLSLPTLIEALKLKTGRDDIDVGKLRPTLFDVYGHDSSPKVKRFMKYFVHKVNRGEREGGMFSMMGSLARYIIRKLEDDEEYGKPALEGCLGSKQEAYAGQTNGCSSLPDSGILISGCQTSETSADASPIGDSGSAYGALSNAIQTILGESSSDGEKVSNRDLVMKARKMLRKQGFTQRPGLYCSDEYVDAPFVC